MSNLGFFSAEEVGQDLKINHLVGCGRCGLYKQSKYPKQSPQGKGKKGILIIGSYYSHKKDQLEIFLERKGVNIFQDCWRIGALSCIPYDPRKPTGNEINMCRPKLWENIKKLKPKVIFLMGESALLSFLGDRWVKGIGNMAKWVGWTIPDRKAKAWVCPIYPPTYVNTIAETNKAITKIWGKDILKGLELINKPVTQWEREQDQVIIIENKKNLNTFLSGILGDPYPIGIDFETSGTKPHAPDHFIKSCSISTNELHSEAFLIPPEESEEYSLLQQIISNPNIPKYIQNMQFEIKWALEILKVMFQGIVWDTQLASHILDNRPGITSLKFQTYIHFGVADYASSISSYLKGNEKDGGNGLNRINEAPITELLTYNGCDTIFLYRLALLQMKVMGY